MSTQSEQARQLVDYYVDQLSGWSHITTRPLFGAVALYGNDHVFAMVWQGALYFKVDDQSRAEAQGIADCNLYLDDHIATVWRNGCF